MGEAPELISVVITCFNLERYIGDALRSVERQRNAGPFEVIVVDDASTDGSAAIVAAFPNVRLIRSPANGGVMQAMLRGVEAARGDIICLLDGDDLWEPDKLATMRRTFADDRIAFATHDFVFVDAAAAALDRVPRCRTVLRPIPEARRPARVRDGILRVDDHVWLGSALSFRRSRGDWAGFRAWVEAFPDPDRLYQDWPLAFWIAAHHRSDAFAYLDVALLRYRLHGENHSGDAGSPARAARNFGRAAATMGAMATLARERRLPWPVVRQVQARADLYEANALACAGRRPAAFRLLPAALRAVHISGGRQGLVRLAASLLLGPAGADRLRATLHRLRAGMMEVRSPRRRRA